MSKKRTGLWIAFGAVLGAAAAGISYYLKYKSFNDELEQDFHDYEEEEDAKEEKNSGAVSCGESGRSYIHLNSGKCGEGSAKESQSGESSGSCVGDEKKDAAKEAEVKAEEAGMDATEERETNAEANTTEEQEANAEANAAEEQEANAETNAAEEQEANAGTNAADPREKGSQKETASHVTVEEDTEGADA